jgi:large subunit ribosomal protein L35
MAKIKVKSHSGAKKRFKSTGKGKFTFQKTNRRHNLTKRSPKRKRNLRVGGVVGPEQHHQVVAMLPYGA